MHCTNCATELPPGAMFCGECGRAVTAEARRSAPRGSSRRSGELSLEERISSLPEIIFDLPDEEAVDPAESSVELEPLILPEASPASTGSIAVASLSDSDIDGRTGSASGDDDERIEAPAFLAEPAIAAEPVLAPEPVVAAEPGLAPEPVVAAEPVLAPEPVVAAEPVLAPEPAIAPEVESPSAGAGQLLPPAPAETVWDLDADPEPSATPPASDGSPDGRCRQCGAELQERDIFCGECGFVRPVSRSASATGSTARVERGTAAYDPFPWGLPPGQPLPSEAAAAERFDPVVTDPPPFDDEHDTRIVGPKAEGERYVLQFSTGESISVWGTGLLGRNPHAEPGEYFDSVVPITDPGRSVSKTHLEFGQEDGSFWVSDRYSGNGTVVREPEQAPRRCEPGKRYRVVRGTRVEIGEQFFIVS